MENRVRDAWCRVEHGAVHEPIMNTPLTPTTTNVHRVTRSVHKRVTVTPYSTGFSVVSAPRTLSTSTLRITSFPHIDRYCWHTSRHLPPQCSNDDRT